MNQSGGEVNTLAVAVVTFITILGLLTLLFAAVHAIVKLATRPEKHLKSPNPAKPPAQSQRPVPHIAQPRPNYSEVKVRHEYLERVATEQRNKSFDTVVHPPSSHSEAKVYRYEKRQFIMSPTEQAFYRRLFRAVGREYLIFPQIHLSSILAHHYHRQDWRAALSKIQRKSVDYVLCDTNFRVLCAIELDDKTHDAPDRRDRDAFVNQIFSNAKLPLLRVPVQNHRSEVELSGIIRHCIEHQTSFRA